MSSAFSTFFKKHIVGGLIITAVAFLISVLFYFSIFDENYFLFSKTARLELDINGQKRAFEGEVVEGMTVLGALQASALAGNISLNFTVEKDGQIMIKSLDGYSDKDRKRISFYHNSLRIEVEEIQSRPINAGDVVSIIVE